MKCDRCDNEATVHELTVHNRKRQERHLCEACAKAQGMAAAAGGTPPGHIPITHLLNEFITSQMQGPPGAQTPAAGPRSAEVAAGVCRSCGLTLNQFRQTGLLGCPDCYAAFESQLSPLLQKAHEGASQHTGKRPLRLRGVANPTVSENPPVAPTPRAAGTRTAAAKSATAGSSAQSASPVSAPAGKGRDHEAAAAELRAKLAAAIAEERYEDAASVRDEILKLAQATSTPPTPAAPPSTPAKATRKPGVPRAPKPPSKPDADSEGPRA